MQLIGVDLHLPGSTANRTATVHQNNHETGYVCSGDQCGVARLAGAETFLSRFFWCGVDTEVSSEVCIVGTIGDSITDGYTSVVDTFTTYPDQLASMLLLGGLNAPVLNLGLSGNRLLRNWSGPSLLSRFDRDVSSIVGMRWLVALIGINDIGLPGYLDRSEDMPTLAELKFGYEQLVARTAERGITMVLGTITPSGGGSTANLGFSTAEVGQLRMAINEWIRSSRIALVADFDAALRDPRNPDRLLPQFDSGDNLHPSAAGYGRMAEVAKHIISSDKQFP